jgi:hypothetical protein
VADASTVGPFEPTHVVPSGGLKTYEVTSLDQPSTPLDPGLDVQVAERWGDWARVVCSNGWSAWVDGRLLEPIDPGAPHDAAAPIDAVLASLLDDAMAKYAVLVGDLKAGRIDDVEFRRAAFHAGLVVRDVDAWILDLSSRRWWRYDGVALTTADVEPPAGKGS